MNPVLVGVLIAESVLIVLTSAALTLPKSVQVRQWVGLSLLAVTFCWSIVAGSLIALHRYQSLQGF